MGLFRRKGSEGKHTGGESTGGDTGRSTPAGQPEPGWAAPDSPDELPDQLADLAFLALDHALDSISEGGPLIPLVLLEGAEGRAGHRFVGDTLEEGIAQASSFVAADPQWQRAILAYDGYLTAEGQRTDAIYVLAWDRPSRTAVEVAHRYLPGSPTGPLQRVGNPIYLGAAAGPGVSPVG